LLHTHAHFFLNNRKSTFALPVAVGLFILFFLSCFVCPQVLKLDVSDDNYAIADECPSEFTFEGSSKGFEVRNEEEANFNDYSCQSSYSPIVLFFVLISLNLILSSYCSNICTYSFPSNQFNATPPPHIQSPFHFIDLFLPFYQLA